MRVHIDEKVFERRASFEKAKQIDFAREKIIFNSKNKFIIIIVSIRLLLEFFFFFFIIISEYFACRFVGIVNMLI